MTLWVVADSGILLATVLDANPTREKAEALLTFWQKNKTAIAAPSLFHYEIVAVIRKHVARGNLTSQEGLETRDLLLEKQVTLIMDRDLLERAYDLATELDRPTAYDSQYLATAERLNCEFWTADERLFNAVNHKLPWVKWLNQFSKVG